MKGTDSNRFMWTAFFPDVRGRRVGDCRRGRDLKASGLRAVAVPSRAVVPGRVELPTSTLSV